MKTLKDLLIELNAYESFIKWTGNKTIEEVVKTCHKGEWLLWLAHKVNIGIEPLTLAKGHCANTVRHIMKDKRSIEAVDTAIDFGEEKASMRELDFACDVVIDFADPYPASAEAYADFAAASAACDNPDHASVSADTAIYAAAAAEAAAHTSSARAENQMQTADICRKYIGDLIIEKVNKQLKTT